MSTQDAITEDQLENFEGWLHYQKIDAMKTSPEEFEALRCHFDEMKLQAAALPKLGRMNMQRGPDDKAYAVAIEKNGGLWITLWVKHASKGDIHVFQPRQNGSWNPHTSYHRSGQYHYKSYGQIRFRRALQSPIAENFRGTEHLGNYNGHGTGAGAIYDNADFDGVIVIPHGLLNPSDGSVYDDVVEAGQQPRVDVVMGTIVHEKIFDAAKPHIAVRIVRPNELGRPQSR
jgi:hypothetical protein